MKLPSIHKTFKSKKTPDSNLNWMKSLSGYLAFIVLIFCSVCKWTKWTLYLSSKDLSLWFIISSLEHHHSFIHSVVQVSSSFSKYHLRLCKNNVLSLHLLWNWFIAKPRSKNEALKNDTKGNVVSHTSTLFVFSL